MNKNAKRLSALLAVLMMSSSFAAVVSAADTTFIKPANKAETVVNEADEKTVSASTLKTSGWIKTDAHILEKDSTVTFVKPSTSTKPVKQIYKNEKPFTVSGTYYSKADAEKELKKYFEEHTYELFLYEDDARLFCDGAYFVSENEDVVYYDYATDRLVANGAGSAYVYVYTKGGIPFFRLDVSVIKSLGGGYTVVDLIPDEWRLDGAGDTTGFTIDGGKYDAEDFKLSIVHGKDIASFNKNGELKVTGNGPIVVRATLKNNANVYGEALLYAGEYVSSFYDGYYTYSSGKYDKYNNACNQYTTWYWGYDYDICDVRDYYINGWIKSYDGILIPVLKKYDATVIEADGSERETTIVSYDKVSVGDLLRDAYGDKDALYTIIKEYNLFKKN